MSITLIKSDDNSPVQFYHGSTLCLPILLSSLFCFFGWMSSGGHSREVVAPSCAIGKERPLFERWASSDAQPRLLSFSDSLCGAYLFFFYSAQMRVEEATGFCFRASV